MALGVFSQATAYNAAAIGFGSIADRTSTVSVGAVGSERQVVNVAAGTQDTDAVNVKQLKNAGLSTDTSGNVTNAFVAYDSTTKDKVTLGGGATGTTVTNVKAGTLSASSTDAVNGSQLYATNSNVTTAQGTADAAKTAAANAVQFSATGGNADVKNKKLVNVAAGTADTDAVNVKQLKAAGLSTDTSGNVTNAFVAYDSTTKDKVTLGGGATGTTVTNVKAGALSASSTDAVNGSQLYATNSNVTTAQGTADAAKTAAANAVQFSATGGNADVKNKKLVNVAAGTADTDAVNVKQLKAAGLSTDTSGNMTNAFVAYDSTTKDKVTLGGGATGTTVTNVKAGALSASSTDAVNGSQLFATNSNVTNLSTTVSNITNGNAGIKYFHVNSSGADSSATGSDGIAIGSKATAKSTNGVAIGNTANAQDGSTVAVGANSNATGSWSVALGANAMTSLANSVALGSGASSTATNAVALGYNALADRANSVSVGKAGAERQIANVAAGTADTDAVNVKQLKAAGLSTDTSGNVTNAFVAYDSTTKDKVTLGGGATGTTVTNVKVGTLSASSTDAVNGSQLYATNQNVSNVTSTVNNITNGGGIKYFHTNSALADSTTKGADSIAIGGGASSDGKWGMALGTNSSATGDNSVALGNSSVADRANTVSVGSATAQRQVVNMAKGTADTDAVSVLQLKGVTSALGGGSTVNADGTIKAPTYTVQGQTATDVGTALSKIDSATTKNTGDITTINTNINNGTVGLVQQASKGAKLTVGKATDGSVVDFLGTAGARQLTNVAKGAVNATSVDAINGSQLYSTAQSAADAFGGGTTVDANGKITKPKYSIDGTDYNNVGDALSAVQSTASGTDAMAVKYDTAAKTKITLAGQAGTTLANVAAGKADLDAVNVKQLKDAGVIDGNGNSVKAVLFNGPNGEASVAGKKIVNVAAGTAATDAVNFGQLTAASTSEAAALGGGSTVNADGTITKPKYKVGGKDAVGVDGAVTALDGRIDGVAGDVSTITNNINNGTTGLVQQASKGAKLTVGNATDGSVVDFLGTAGARQLTNVAKGAVNATSVDAINGSQLYSTAQSAATALGGGSAVNADGTIKAPTYTVQGQTATDVGTALSKIDSATTKNTGDITTINTNINGLQKDSLQWDATAGSFTAKHDTSETNKIASVAAGTAATDAVNFGQLTAASTSEAAALGGGSTVNADGTITKPKYKLDGGKTTADNVGDAITNLDGRTTDNSSAITNITNNINSGTVGLVQQAAAGETLTVGKNTDGTEVNFTGTAGDRMLTGLVAGTVDNAAVNVSQLKGVADTIGGGAGIDPTTGKVINPTWIINKHTDGTGGTTVSNVGDAITSIDDRVTTVQGDVTNITNQINDGTIGMVQQAAAGEKLTVGKNTDGTEVNFTGTAGDRMLTGVAAGTVDNAAVNLGQLKGAVDGLGGGASIDSTTGAVTGPTYNVTNIDGTTTKVHNVGDAVTMIDGRVTNIDGRVTNVEGDITNIMNGTTGMVQQASAGEKLTVGKDTNGKVVDFTGTAGERQLTGVATGAVNASSVDAINGAQLFGVSQSVADAMGGGSTVNPDGTIAAPSYTVAGTTVNNIGDAITNIDGRVTQNAGDISSINNTLNNITNGAGITYFHANSTLADSQALGMESVAIGGNAQSRAANSVALGSNSVADRANSVSVGSAGNERQITNVAAGTADTDAVNVAQLKASGIINPNGTTNTAVTYDKSPDGTTNYNSITMGGGVDGGTTIHNVAGGTAGNDAVNVNQMNQAISSVTNIAQAANNPMFSADGNRDTEGAIASGSHATAMGANAKASAANSVAMGANSVADRENTMSVGSAGSERQITNVANGTAATDAVNVGQMNDSIGAAVGNLPGGMTAKDYTDQQVKTVQSGVNQVARGAYSGVAAATALSMIPDVDLGKTIAVGVGTANYKGYQATAIGASVRITQNLKAKLGAGISAAGTTIGAGASYQW
ncbi:YadA-like family protein [Paraburkholderia dilworthii]|uniref:YadA-like family protein n=1 Tax=Paraburkholderia dilworthii TaxID=948106 RepID=A0ABW9DBP5_9BURK